MPDPGSCSVFNGQYTQDCRALYLPLNETATTLSFYDAPANSCLPGGGGYGCGATAPAGSYMGFTTHLVGILGTYPNATVVDTGIAFDWTDNFNGTSGGISVTNATHSVDAGSGKGSIAVTNSNSVSTYQKPSSLVINAVNGHKSGQLPPLTLLTKTQVSTVLLGLARNLEAKNYLDVLTIRNVSGKDIKGPIQVLISGLPKGVTVFKASGYFGNNPYVTIPEVTDLPSGAVLILPLVLKDPALTPVKVIPFSIYAGTFK